MPKLPITNTERDWGTLSMLFHWLVALAILGNFALGWYAEGMRLSPLQLKLFLYHKSIGLTILALALLRLLWRWSQPVPALPPAMPAWERRAAHLSHFLLYLLMLATPLAGWYLNSVANVPLRWFGWFEVPALAAGNDAVREPAELLHVVLAWSLIIVAALHVGAALKHHFHDRDDVLRRMLPLRRKSP